MSVETPGADTSRTWAWMAGVISVGVGLGVSELVSGLAGSSVSLITAVGDRFVYLSAGALKDIAVAIFGTHDKTALQVGIVLISLALGAWLGQQAYRRRIAGFIGFAVFGVIGLLAGLGAPLASPTVIVVASLSAAAVGSLILDAMIQSLRRLDRDADPTSAGDPTASRRGFLALAAGAGAAAVVTGVVGKVATTSRSVAEGIRDAVLPAAKVSAKVPESQPFSVPGLTSYIIPNNDFYRIDTALTVPRVDTTTWQLKISGMVDEEVTFSYSDLLAMDLRDEAVTLSCVSNEVGGDLVGNAVWRGIPLKDLLDRAGVQDGATQIVGRSVDGFSAGFPSSVLQDGRTVMVAVGMNGEPLPEVHGFPARLVVAGLYGYVSATKWPSEIGLTRWEDVDGFWIPRGWSKEGPIKLSSRIDVPRQNASLNDGTVMVAGVAWQPTHRIRSVEVKIDDSGWQKAELGRVASDETWVQWRYPWNASAGKHSITVRAVDVDGNIQIQRNEPPAPNGATGYDSRQVRVK